MHKSIVTLLMSAGIAIVGAQISVNTANAQSGNVGTAYFSWDWGLSPQGSATYFVICDNPELNTHRARGGDCIEVNVANENVSNKRGTTVKDCLVVGTKYRTCISSDNHPRVGRGRWITCKVFTMSPRYRLSFGVGSMQYIGEP